MNTQIRFLNKITHFFGRGQLLAIGFATSVAFAYLFSSSIYAVVPGITSGKLVVPTADILTDAEAEISASYERSRSFFRDDGKKTTKDLRSANPFLWGSEYLPNEEGKIELKDYGAFHKDYTGAESSSSLGFRVSSGLLPKLEGGVTFGNSISKDTLKNSSAEADGFGVGLKYLLNDSKSPARFALQAGSAFDSHSWSPTYEGGLIATFDLIPEKLSLDIDGTLSSTPKGPHGAAAHIGLGYSFEKWAPAIELEYTQNITYSERNVNFALQALDRGFINEERSEKYTQNVFKELLKSSYPEENATIPVDFGNGKSYTFVVPNGMTERVRKIEKKVTLWGGFSYTPTEKSAITFLGGTDLGGSNTTRGNAFSVAVGWKL